MKKARNEFSSLFLYDYAAFSVLYTSIGIESSKIRMDMRLLILSFFAALLGYSLLFERREVKPTDDLQESSAASVRFTPIIRIQLPILSWIG